MFSPICKGGDESKGNAAIPTWWLIIFPTEIHMLKSYPTGPLNVTFFGDRIFTEVIKLKGDYYGGPLSKITDVFIKRETLVTNIYTRR